MPNIEKRAKWIQDQLQEHRPQFGFVASEIIVQVLCLDRLCTAARTNEITVFKDANGEYHWQFTSCWWSFTVDCGPHFEDRTDPDPSWKTLTPDEFKEETDISLLDLLNYIVNAPESMGDIFTQEDEGSTEREIERLEEWLSRQRIGGDDKSDGEQEDEDEEEGRPQ